MYTHKYHRRIHKRTAQRWLEELIADGEIEDIDNPEHLWQTFIRMLKTFGIQIIK